MFWSFFSALVCFILSLFSSFLHPLLTDATGFQVVPKTSPDLIVYVDRIFNLFTNHTAEQTHLDDDSFGNLFKPVERKHMIATLYVL